ncbi:flagellar biosynthesis protein FlhG [Nitrosospira sp. Nsp2]|uniref:AAA family ATPase n=1 Tax=Nitrosospira sp. Nsp2 TaxID=136548 RepID=UPI000D30696A|nr:AAA family ATPase [Nitrosospira sp. Nsp2]PTR16443.1 flagellar biosynthesis protein FlhG [Nitrosospira sp. Nsp2]
MAEHIHDQADGLRRLLMQDFVRVVTVTSGGAAAGKTTTVIGLAVALARDGKKVLVIDENVGARNICATLGLNAHRDLLDVIRRDKALDAVIVTAREGIRVLPAGRGMRVLEKLGADDKTHLIDAFAGIDPSVDVVLIDAAPGSDSRALPLALPSHEIVMVLPPEPASITAAYALIKHISSHHESKRRYHVLFNKTELEADARKIFENMESAAKRYLSVTLHLLGFVPYDGKHCLGRGLAEVHPNSPSAGVFRLAAESLAHWPCQDGEGPGLERFMQCLLQGNQGGRQNAIAARSQRV